MVDELAALESLYQVLANYLVSYSFQLIGAIIILMVGWWLSGSVGRGVSRICEKKNLDVTLSRFFASLTKLSLFAVCLVIAISTLGITISPLIAAIGALTFGLSLAIQGPVSNFGAGLAIILTRPYKVGDTVTLKSRCGVVDDIRLGMTTPTTEEGEKIFIPNKEILGEIFHNSYEWSLLETEVGISYGDDPKQVVELLADALRGVEEVNQTPAPQIGINSFGDSAINIGVRCWLPTHQFHQCRFKVNMAIWQAVKENGVTIPFPQREVKMVGKEAHHSGKTADTKK